MIPLSNAGISFRRIFSMVFVVVAFQRHAEIRGRQHRENERLEESHQELQRHHKERERNSCRRSCHRTAHAGAAFAENKNQSDEAQHYDVSCRDIGKKTQQQREWFEK